MRILVTNDDGIGAPGLTVCEAIAATLGDEVWTVAPHDERSGAGHSLTLTKPLRVRRHGERRFAVTGTPTDAVIMALTELLEAPPDLILSGVNHGANLADDATCSGTVSAAMEGALAGIRSIALSQRHAGGAPGADVSFAAAWAWGARVVAPLLAAPFARGTLVNVNFPALPPEQVRGVRVTAQGRRDHGRATIARQTDPRGFPCYWLSLGRTPVPATTGGDTDLEAVRDGWIAVTPLQLDLTDREGMRRLAGLYA